MVRRMVFTVAAVVVLLGSGIRTEAAVRTGAVRVELDYSGVSGSFGQVVLYRVGEPSGGGCRLTADFGGGLVKRGDEQAPELARWLAAEAGGAGTVRHLDADGAAEFTQLQEGLYLLVQTEAPEGYQCADPFLIPIPCSGEWTVLAKPKTSRLLTQSPQTGQRPAPLLAAMGLVLSGLGVCLCVEKLRKK